MAKTAGATLGAGGASGQVRFVHGVAIPGNEPIIWQSDGPEGNASGMIVKTLTADGEIRRHYNAEHWEKADREKFQRVRELINNEDRLDRHINAGLRSSDERTRQSAEVTYLIKLTGMRPGKPGNEGRGKVITYGATSLRVGHVQVRGNTVRLQYVGKKGVVQDRTITDKKLATFMRARVNAAKKTGDPDARIFPKTNDRFANSFVRSGLPKNMANTKIKDIRTMVGIQTAVKVISKMPRPTTAKQLKVQQKEVYNRVANQLGNTPATAKKSYVDPHVFSEWNI